MTLNFKKCVFGKPTIELLGHKINSKGIATLPNKVEAIKNFPKPKLAKELRSFIAMINFYLRFTPNAMETQLILQSMLTGNKKNDKTQLVLTDETEKAFNDFKDMLVNATLLAHPQHNTKIILAVDVFDNCVGAAFRTFGIFFEKTFQ